MSTWPDILLLVEDVTDKIWGILFDIYLEVHADHVKAIRIKKGKDGVKKEDQHVRAKRLVK